MPTPMERYLQGFQFGMGFLNDILRRQMQEREFGQKERYYEMMEPYYGAMIEKMQRPEEPSTPFALWKQQNPEAAIADWFELQRQGKAEPTPTAAEREFAFDVENILRARRQAQTGIVGPPIPEKILKQRAWQQAYERKYGEKEKPAPKPMISTKELMNKVAPRIMAGQEFPLSPKAKHEILAPFENLATSQVDTVYTQHGMPDREEREQVLRDIHDGIYGSTRQDIKMNLMEAHNWKQEIVDWILSLTRFR